jgi:phosphoribosylaminoimidazole-succinocarboxamide synthase
MSNVIVKTDFNFPGQNYKYIGKVRDVYTIKDKYLIMVATDRISAFDVVLPKGIPYKGQVLNQIASRFLDATADICPNWKIATPHGHHRKVLQTLPGGDDYPRLPDREFMEIL